MANFNEKIAAITALMENGVLDAQEQQEIVRLLTDKHRVGAVSKSPFERKYEGFMKNNVAIALKNPFSAKFPPLQRSMIKQGDLSVCLEEGNVIREFHYIETYIESMNSYGNIIRENIVIILDEKLNFTMVLQELKHSLMQTGLRQWIPMAGVIL